MERNIRKKYFKRLRATLKSKLNAKHVFQAINTWIVPTVRYGAGITELMKEEVNEMDLKTRKIVTMYGGLYPRLNVEPLYLRNSEGGRGLVSREDCASDERTSLALYTLRSYEDLINVQNRQERRKRLVKLKEKDLHRQSLKERENTDMMEIDVND